MTERTSKTGWNWTLIIVAIISSFPSTFVALLSYHTHHDQNKAIKEIHVIVNNQKTEMLKEISELKEKLFVEKSKDIGQLPSTIIEGPKPKITGPEWHN